MKKTILIFSLAFMILLPSGCGSKEDTDSSGFVGAALQKAFENQRSKKTQDDDEQTHWPQEDIQDDETMDGSIEDESVNVTPFPTSEVSFDIPKAVMDIIKGQPRKPNFTDFIVDLGDDGILTQSTYHLEDPAFRNDYFCLVTSQDGTMESSDMFPIIKENEASSQRFPLVTENVALTQRNTALQVFGDNVFIELFNKDMGKEFVGVSYKNGDVTEPIKIDELGTDSPIIFGNAFLYYINNGYLHRVDYALKTDEKMFYLGERLSKGYATGELLGDVYNNTFSLVNHKLVFACPAPKWILEYRPEEGEKLSWAENQTDKPDSRLNQLRAAGVELDLNELYSAFDYHQDIKTRGAVEHNLDMTKTGYTFSPDTKIVLALDLINDKFEVVSYQVGEFYKAYQFGEEMFIEASPVFSVEVEYENLYPEVMELPFSIQIYKVPSMENVTKTLTGEEVDSIAHSVFIPTIRGEEKGFVAYAANVTNPEDSNRYKQVIKYNGKDTEPLTNNILSHCEIVRVYNCLAGYIGSSDSWMGPSLYTCEWDSEKNQYEWKKY